MQREFEFKMNEQLRQGISPLTPCYIVKIILVRFNKLEYARDQKIKSSDILWKSE